MSADCTTTSVLRGIDLTGRTAVITGASSGLGRETARALMSAGCDVIAAVRDIERTRAALGDGDCDVVALDLSDLDSVRAAARVIAAHHPHIDLLINNAGVMAAPLSRTRQGFELQLGTNHLGHFAFTQGLLGVLGEGSRIVNLTSRGHFISGIRWKDPNFEDETSYDKWEAYGQSKSANVLFTVELERRLADRGIHAFAVHPGAVVTELGRHVNREDAQRFSTLEYSTVSQGAATAVWAATSPELAGLGGLYLEDCRIAVPFVEGQTGGYAAHAVDPDQAARLWEWSEHQLAQLQA